MNVPDVSMNPTSSAKAVSGYTLHMATVWITLTRVVSLIAEKFDTLIEVMKMRAGSKSKRKASSLNSKRVQTVLTTEQYELLVQVAKKKKKPVSAVVREAIEA